MSDETKIRALPAPPPKGPPYAPDMALCDYLMRMADLAADGQLGGVLILYRKEDGFGHFLIPPSGAHEVLALAGLMDYVKNRFVLTKVTSG